MVTIRATGIDPTVAKLILVKSTQAVTLQKSQPLHCASAGVASPRQSSWQAGALLEVQGLGFRVQDFGLRTRITAAACTYKRGTTTCRSMHGHGDVGA